MVTFIADRGDARLRLDQAIVRRLRDVPRISRTRVQRWIDARLVFVNDEPARRASSPLAAGDRVAVSSPEAAQQRTMPRPEAGALGILHEDAHLLAVDKPAGVVVHPSYKHASGTLLNAILGHLDTAATREPIAGRLLNRLDKHTSGVLLVSKSIQAHVALQRAMSEGRVRKEYLAIVHGRPKRGRGVLTFPLGIDPQDRRRVIVRDDGRASETRFEVLARSAGRRTGGAGIGAAMALLRCDLITGRTHQIRVHLAAAGWPIVGDTVYGKEGDTVMRRQALHAWRLTFRHPVSGAAMQITAPVPPDMEALLIGVGLHNFTL